MQLSALALWCAVAAAACACAAAYTVDCNHEYTDCDNELSKLTSEDDDMQQSATTSAATLVDTTQAPPKRTPPKTSTVTTTERTAITEDTTDDSEPKPRSRLINLSINDLQSFAEALHNQTHNPKTLADLSDVNLDADEEETPKLKDMKGMAEKLMPNKFFSNLQPPMPFHPMVAPDKGSEEDSATGCKDNDIMFKIGEKIDRGCEETCECMLAGNFECSPRCKHPYIRRGRRLSDPLCFESPVDDCCSIIACATGNGETKIPNVKESCKYENETYAVGTKWSLGCEQICSCEGFGLVSCKPRCAKLPPSDKCINVQDPNDACCEVQVCDVSQDVHEEPLDNSTSTTSAPATSTTGKYRFPDDLEELAEEIKGLKSTMRPLVLAEPIGSVKVLQNNTVQVNLMHMNNSQDPIHLLLSSDGGKTFKSVELKYKNLILNLEGGKDYVLKTKETGTKFNFTITSMGESRVNQKQDELEAFSSTEEMTTDASKVGCNHEGKFYAVGEEYHIGCSELCECTGQNRSECAALECPNHVGLELVSRGCVQWAPGPPPQPPNCCPRSARCLSDGTCHYRGHAVPNWSEVPIALTGCEERCFCENGELDCQEVCTPLSPVPPQTLRCPPGHRPAPVNISDEDCCKHWGCLPNVISLNKTGQPLLGRQNTTSSQPPITPHLLLKAPWTFTESMKGQSSKNKAKGNSKMQKDEKYGDISIYTPMDIAFPYKVIRPEPMVRDEYDFSYNKAKPIISIPKYISPNVVPLKPLQTVIQFQDMYHMDEVNEYTPPEPYNLQDKRREINKSNKLFRPKSAVLDVNRNFSQIINANENFFQPTNNTLSKYNVSVKIYPQFMTSPPIQHVKVPNNYRHITVLKAKDIFTRTDDRHSYNLLLTNDSKIHILAKDPTPYEAVIFRFPHAVTHAYAQSSQVKPRNATTELNLEQLLDEMNLGSETSKNTQRSTNRLLNVPLEAGATLPPPAMKPHTQQPFLPTIPAPEPYPPEDIDYEQNNIQRPVQHIPVTPPIKPILPTLPGLPPPPPNYGEDNKKLTVISLLADSPISVKMLFGLPPVLVGLRGSVDLRYTDKAEEDDITRWQSQVFAPADEILSTSRLEFRLAGLKPSTVYRIRGKLFLHNLPVEPVSDVYSVRTLDLPTVEEKRREIDSRLTVMDTNDTTAHVSWRHFSEDELLLIDGIQVRYRPVGTPIYIMTELLHHSRSNAELRELRPGSRYEASLVLVPPPRALTELFDPTTVEFTTAPYVDPYNWSVVLEARSVGAEAAELTWRGVPSPAERWVRVYRAAHACGDGRAREHDAFRLAARDQPPLIALTGLEPDTRCRVWLELFLTNGKVKTSNVLEVNTKSLDQPEPIDNAIEASSIGGRTGPNRGDYYGALVVVGVIAALGAVTSLLLLLIVVRRHRPRSVPITPVPSAPRDSSLPPYESPAYKLELQQETMDL